MKKILTSILLGLSALAGVANAGMNYWTPPVVMPTVPVMLSATSGSIGGSLLLLGTCTTSNVAVTGANTGMSVQATPAVTPGAGAIWYGYVSAADTVTVKVCALVALTPVSTVYNIRVF